MTAHQTIKATETTTTVKKGLPSILPVTDSEGATENRGPGRPVGAKDTVPRKPRSDKGKKRGPYKKRAS